MSNTSNSLIAPIKVSKTSQTKEILKYMREHPKTGISSMEAIRMFGATRLAGIIFALKRRGYDITTEMVDGVNRYGRHLTYAVYRLHEETEDGN